MKRLSLALIAVLLLASPAAGQEDSPGRKDPLVLHPKGDATQGAIRPEQARAVAAVARALFAQGREAYLRGDYTEAVRLYRLAAEEGHAAAQLNLGFMYRHGLRVPQDYTEGVRWFRMAAEQGDARAQVNLGFMYHFGDGVPQDYTEAVRLYRLAAEQGLATAQSILGDMNRDGQGVPQDFVTAHVWYNLSASRGFQTAASARADVARRMTPEQIAEAQRLAREWQAAFEGRQ